MPIREIALQRPQFWSRFVLIAGAALVALSLVACGSDEKADEAPTATTQTGADLADKFITLLHEKDTAGLDVFLSDAFLLQRADGSFAAKVDYLPNLPQIGEFTIANVTAKQFENTLIVRWDLSVIETINGTQFAGSPAPRLSTFVWDGEDWKMASHANFNVPASTTVPAAPVN